MMPDTNNAQSVLKTAASPSEAGYPTPDPGPGTGPSDSQDAGPDGSEGRHRSRHRKSRNSRMLAREKRISRNLKIVLAVLLVVITGVLVIGSKTQNHLVDQNDQLQVALNKSRAQAKRAEAMAERLRDEVETLVDARIPGLSDIRFDEVIPLNEQYVKNVILGLSSDEGRTSYEYRFTLFNREITPILPDFDMYFFDHNGMQIGAAPVTKTGAASKGLVRALAPGEIRSYSGRVDVIRGREPKYFMITPH